MNSAAIAPASTRLPRHLALCCDYDGEDTMVDPARSRAAIRAAIERRYTAAG